MYHWTDWTNSQRDETVKANKRAGASQTTALAIDSSFGQVYSFTYGRLLDDRHTTTTEMLSQESATLLTGDSNTTSCLREFETSSIKLSLDYSLPAKRFNKHSKRSPQTQRKRRSASESNGDGELFYVFHRFMICHLNFDTLDSE